MERPTISVVHTKMKRKDVNIEIREEILKNIFLILIKYASENSILVVNDKFVIYIYIINFIFEMVTSEELEIRKKIEKLQKKVYYYYYCDCYCYFY
jgi:hypothetical protein